MFSVKQLLILVTIVTVTPYAELGKMADLKQRFSSRDDSISNSVLEVASKPTRPTFPNALIVVSVKQSLLAMARADRSTAPRLIRLYDGKSELKGKKVSLYYANFTAAYTKCSANGSITLEDVYSSKCPVEGKKGMISCTGYVELSGERTGRSLHCEPAEGFENWKYIH
ncbi:hypothetical protein M514_10505 [Trichuris suis]|uniref:Uncharacterized protein n=1 Tax=Trichuris suis TaxID=68888 RepID=A0A085MYE4_9BILA|nr:hypothetical protein M514_10505 [Trichuris suis]